MNMNEYLSGRCYTACVSHAFFDTPIDLISEEKKQTVQETSEEIFQKLADIIMPGGLVVCLTNEISLAFNVETDLIPDFTLIYPSSSANKIGGIYILQRDI